MRVKLIQTNINLVISDKVMILYVYNNKITKVLMLSKVVQS